MKILSFDLDGTLLKDDKTVSDRSKETLLKCREKGLTLVFNSARPPRMIYDVLPEEFHSEVVISSNGAYITRGDEELYKNFISKEDTRSLIEYLESKHLDSYFSVEFKSHGYTSWKDREYSKKMFAKQVDFREFGVEESSHFFIEIIKFSEKEIDNLREFLPANCRLLILEGGSYAQIMARNNNKLNGILKVVDSYRLGIEDIIAFGDDYNDEEIIKGAGIGVAMGNAEDYIKSIADKITSTNEDDGVACYIENHIL